MQIEEVSLAMTDAKDFYPSLERVRQRLQTEPSACVVAANTPEQQQRVAFDLVLHLLRTAAREAISHKKLAEQLLPYFCSGSEALILLCKARRRQVFASALSVCDDSVNCEEPRRSWKMGHKIHVRKETR